MRPSDHRGPHRPQGRPRGCGPGSDAAQGAAHPPSTPQVPDRTRRTTRRPHAKGTPYRCKVSGKPLVFDESANGNYEYPWRDNFCETRDFSVGRCPAGWGHQGQDIRPSFCRLRNAGADWVDQELVVSGNLITSREPDDLPAFNEALLAALG